MSETYDWAALRAAAERATPGPWFASDWRHDGGDEKHTVEAREPEVLLPGQSAIWPDGVRKLLVAETAEGERPDEDAAYIAAANPQVILALLAGRDAAEFNATKFSARADGWERQAKAAEARAERLAAALRGLLDACERRANREGGDFGPDIGPAAAEADAALAGGGEGEGEMPRGAFVTGPDAAERMRRRDAALAARREGAEAMRARAAKLIEDRLNERVHEAWHYDSTTNVWEAPNADEEAADIAGREHADAIRALPLPGDAEGAAT